MPDPAPDNPYTTLTTDDDPAQGSGGQSTTPTRRVRRFSLFAVLVGVAVDWGLTKLTVPTYLEWLELRYGTAEFFELIVEGPFRWTWSALGWGCSVVGGFVTGRLARQREHLHGLGNLLLTTVLLRAFGEGSPLPFEISLEFLIAHSGNAASILLGAQLAWWLRRRQQR